jgi:hypothetical protein
VLLLIVESEGLPGFGSLALQSRSLDDALVRAPPLIGGDGVDLDRGGAALLPFLMASYPSHSKLLQNSPTFILNRRLGPTRT